MRSLDQILWDEHYGRRSRRGQDPARLAEIQKLAAEGRTLREIGEIFGITRERVRQIVAKNGLPKPAVVRRAIREATAPRCIVCGGPLPTGRRETCSPGCAKLKPKPPIIHGTLTAYSSRGCRCNECHVAHAAYQQRQREERLLRLDEAPHGTISAYVNWGCRCDACRAAGSIANRRGRERRRAKQKVGS